MHTSIADFSVFLANNMGLHYPKERLHELEKKMVPVVKAFGFQDLKSCIQWLMQEPFEQDKIFTLAYYLTIGETYFFRDKPAFAHLEKKIFPEIFTRHQEDRHIRIWSAGCCRGEEPYSLAILLDQIIPEIKSWKIEILGTDINKEFLEKAKKGKYQKWAFRGTPPSILTKYFIKQEDGSHLIIPEIKSRVQFEYLNLANEAYPEFTKKMDLILCHNVLMYFSESRILKVIGHFANSLLNEGWLSISAVEAPYIHDPQLVSMDLSNAIFFKKTLHDKPEQKKSKINFKIASKEETILKVVLPEFLNLPHSVIEFKKEVPYETKKTKIEEKFAPFSLNEIQKLYFNKKYDKVIEHLSYILSHEKKQSQQVTLEYFYLIKTFANQGNLKSALEWCEKYLKDNKLDSNFHYLHGTILHGLGENQKAIEALKHVLFLEPDFIVAHYLLGVLEKQMGRAQKASQHFKTAKELLSQCKPEDILPGEEELTAARLNDLLVNV